MKEENVEEFGFVDEDFRETGEGGEVAATRPGLEESDEGGSDGGVGGVIVEDRVENRFDVTEV